MIRPHVLALRRARLTGEGIRLMVDAPFMQVSLTADIRQGETLEGGLFRAPDVSMGIKIAVAYGDALCEALREARDHHPLKVELWAEAATELNARFYRMLLTRTTWAEDIAGGWNGYADGGAGSIGQWALRKTLPRLTGRVIR